MMVALLIFETSWCQSVELNDNIYLLAYVILNVLERVGMPLREVWVGRSVSLLSKGEGASFG